MPTQPFPHGVQSGSFRIDPHDALPSTNDRARELAAEGAADVAVIADRQTAGRGRLDREWASPPGGIWLSLLVRPSLPVDRVSILTFAAALAVVRAAAEAGVEARLKWPNDVLITDDEEERKLAGILTESSTRDGRLQWAIIGIGVNANVDRDDLPPGSISLQDLVGGVDRTAVTEALVAAFDRLRGDQAGVIEAWRTHAVTLGRRVEITTGDGSITGVATDIDESGRLLVETETGVERVAVGDCRHLRSA